MTATTVERIAEKLAACAPLLWSGDRCCALEPAIAEDRDDLWALLGTDR